MHSLFMATTAAVLLAVSAGSVDAKELKFGTAVPVTTPLGKSIEDGLIPGIAKASGGELTMVAHYHGSVCGEQKCGEQANQGLLAAWTSSTANFGNFGTALSIFDLPYLFKDQDTANQIADGWLGDAASENAAKTTQHKVFEVFSAGGFRQLGNTERTIKSPADMKGIKFRVTKSPIEYTLIKTGAGSRSPLTGCSSTRVCRPAWSTASTCRCRGSTSSSTTSSTSTTPRRAAPGAATIFQWI